MADESPMPQKRDEGLCPWRLAGPDENGHAEFQYECGGQQVGVNLGDKGEVIERFMTFIEQWEWRP
jgi:hypothetical protein